MTDETVGRKTAVLALVGWIAVCFAVAALGSRYMPGSWFAQLKKPEWNPPGWIFAPVWTALYTMMAFAAWRVWINGGWAERGLPIALFLVQLTLNGIWSWIFFGLQRPGLAFGDIVALWIALLITVVLFWKVTPVAACLLLPYLAWVTFASALNFSIWRMNQ